MSTEIIMGFLNQPQGQQAEETGDLSEDEVQDAIFDGRFSFGDLLINNHGEIACFVEYLPDDGMYIARMISKNDKETFCVTSLRNWRNYET